MEIRRATKNDCTVIAELALMAGEGIPAYFRAQSQQPGETVEEDSYSADLVMYLAGKQSAETDSTSRKISSTQFDPARLDEAGSIIPANTRASVTDPAA